MASHLTSKLPALPAEAETKPLIVLLVNLSKAIRQFLVTKLDAIGLFVGQDMIIAGLLPGERLQVGELASRLNIRSSTLTKSADRLITRGYMVREPGSRDARTRLVGLTEEGVRKRQQVFDVWDAVEKELRSYLDEAGERRLLKYLDRLDTLILSRLARLR